jgi:hypothetical protein
MLTEFRAEVIEREAGPMKNRYLGTLGAACAKFGAPALVVAVLAALGAGALGAPAAGGPGAIAITSNVAFLIAACSAGVWVSYGARKAQITFEDLSVPEQDYLYPTTRLVFATILTLAFGLVFHVGAAQVTIGEMKTKEIFSSPAIALIVGFLCGFSEQVLAKSIAAQAKRFIGG